MSIVERLEEASEWTLSKLRAVEAGAMSTQTPCAEWDVAKLANHITGGLRLIARAARGEEPGSFNVSGEGEPDYVGDDPAGAYEGARKEALVALREPGVLDKTLKLPFGEMPAPMVLSIFTTDHLIHGWDVAKCTGQDTTMPSELAELAWGTVNGRLSDDNRGPGKPFAAAVSLPDDAPTQDKLIGYLGRQP